MQLTYSRIKHIWEEVDVPDVEFLMIGSGCLGLSDMSEWQCSLASYPSGGYKALCRYRAHLTNGF